MIIVLLEPAFLFFVLTSGRPLPVTTFFVFSKPLCSHFAAQIVIREFSAPLQKRCLSLSKGFPLQPKFAAAAAQRFYSSFVALLEAILQRCSSAAPFVRALSLLSLLSVFSPLPCCLCCHRCQCYRRRHHCHYCHCCHCCYHCRCCQYCCCCHRCHCCHR